MQTVKEPCVTRTIIGRDAISMLKIAVTGPGLQGKLSRMLEQLGWRHETKVAINGLNNALVGDRFKLEGVDFDDGRGVTTNITSATLDKTQIPLKKNSSQLRELGGGRWQIGRDVIDITQPAGEARLTWP